MVNVNFRNQIKLLNQGYDIKQNPKGQETDRDSARRRQINLLVAQNVDERKQ